MAARQGGGRVHPRALAQVEGRAASAGAAAAGDDGVVASHLCHAQQWSTKSLVGGMDHPSRYRMGEPGMLPKFGSGKNPFQAGAKEQQPILQPIQPPQPVAAPLTPAFSRPDKDGDTPLGAREALLVPRAPALSPPAPTAPQWRESDGERESGGVLKHSSANWSSALRSI